MSVNLQILELLSHRVSWLICSLLNGFDTFSIAQNEKKKYCDISYQPIFPSIYPNLNSDSHPTMHFSIHTPINQYSNSYLWQALGWSLAEDHALKRLPVGFLQQLFALYGFLSQFLLQWECPSLQLSPVWLLLAMWRDSIHRMCISPG